MDLSDLVASLSTFSRDSDVCHAAPNVCQDSRTVKPGDIFVAVPGTNVDGHDFVNDAVSRGAATVVAQKSLTVPEDVRLVIVDDSASALGILSQAANGSPARQLTLLGVTGTNGKTTVAYLTHAILNSSNFPAGMIGTVAYDTGNGQKIAADNTTPDAPRLAQMMADMRRCGQKAVVMECSSHGLDQRRTAGLSFNAAAFTNLTGDHLDYHRTRQAYLDAKAKLFESLTTDAVAVLNFDDPVAAILAQRTQAKTWRYGVDCTDESVEIRAQIKAMGLWGCDLRLEVMGESADLRLALPGRHNVSNLLAAVGLAHAVGIPLRNIVAAAQAFHGVPGRLERVDAGQDFTVLVDYAHTDDALANVLQALSDLQPRRIILVFGCGGDRDRSKRPRMARVAQQFATEIIVTNDNPRTEQPQQIFEDIYAGFDLSSQHNAIHQIPDRRSAIAHAVEMAQPGDAVLIAGKGHEDYQLVGDRRLEFDDRVVARQLLQQLQTATQNRTHYSKHKTTTAHKRQPTM
ncbi:MAG: UDP-N-acetylmuramoyl-L-alanyl-D-glutamate--2,6-diaminopimelate ligase [Sedimentisphaerales bacterium]|nr:UDP-N-acetylmuramoyl-L-alanyl-D-glutamate--2,6-diaminopimelate ligase [Sedimentisphaerales bacterium]